MFSGLNVYKQELLYDWNIKGRNNSRGAFAKTKSDFSWNVKYKYLFNSGSQCRGMLPNKMWNRMSKMLRVVNLEGTFSNFQYFVYNTS